MSLKTINLRKLLPLFFSTPRKQRSLLLADIRSEHSKQMSGRDSGGDFYGPIWADMKSHAAGRSDIVVQTQIRIAANANRARLYPVLKDCFLEMWNEKIRWRNEPFEFVPQNIKARWPIKSLNAIVKIENTASVKLWDGSHRVIYPYFYEQPALPVLGARLGFWALQQALPNYNLGEFRIIDMQRRAYFRPDEVEMDGNEGVQFVEMYAQLLKARRKLEDDQ